MQLNLLSKIIIFSYLCIAGCSTSPPELPPDYSSVQATHSINQLIFTAEELAKTCSDIKSEVSMLDNQLSTINNSIKEDRTSDQTIAYLFGAITTLFDPNTGAREYRQIIYQKKDKLRLLNAYKKC